MTTVDFVRLDAPDLAAMARRASTLLTDDGARSWYRNDVTRLLQEITALRTERAEAAQSFQAWMAEEYDESAYLPALAERWREHATGLWEKAQVKKLKAERDEAKADSARTAAELEALREEYSRSERQVGMLSAALTEMTTRLEQTQAEARAKLGEHLARIAQYEERERDLQAQLEAASADCQVRVMSEVTAHEALKTAAREHMTHALEALG
jgi:chromosome segregation ATPase